MPAVQFVPVDEVVPVSGANLRCVPEAAITIDDTQAQRIAELCAALSDPVRLRMVLALRESPGDAANLRDLLPHAAEPEATDRTAWHPDDAVGWTVVRLAHRLGRQFDHALKQLALTPRQFGVLATIAAEPGINSGQLARKVLVTAQSMGELITGLEKAGYLTRDHDRGQGRRLDTQLTPAGHDVLTRAFGVVAGLNTLLHKALTHLQP